MAAKTRNIHHKNVIMHQIVFARLKSIDQIDKQRERASFLAKFLVKESSNRLRVIHNNLESLQGEGNKRE